MSQDPAKELDDIEFCYTGHLFSDKKEISVSVKHQMYDFNGGNRIHQKERDIDGTLKDYMSQKFDMIRAKVQQELIKDKGSEGIANYEFNVMTIVIEHRGKHDINTDVYDWVDAINNSNILIESNNGEDNLEDYFEDPVLTDILNLCEAEAQNLFLEFKGNTAKLEYVEGTFQRQQESYGCASNLYVLTDTFTIDKVFVEMNIDCIEDEGKWVASGKTTDNFAIAIDGNESRCMVALKKPTARSAVKDLRNMVKQFIKEGRYTTNPKQGE